MEIEDINFCVHYNSNNYHQEFVNCSEIIKLSSQYFQYSSELIFRLGMYREPGRLILVGVLPIFVLVIFLVATFFQNKNLADKVQNLAAIFLALVAFIPSLRSEIPSVSEFTYIDKQIFCQIFCILLVLIDSVVDQYFRKYDYEPKGIYSYVVGIVMGTFFAYFYLVNFLAR